MSLFAPLLKTPLCAPDDLGRPIPDSPHAVSVCLPTWRDNVGYEKQEPRVTSQMNNGYPRFVYHHLCRELFAVCEERFADEHESCLAFPTTAAARHFADFFAEQSGTAARICDVGHHGVQAVCFPTDQADIAKAAWQHLGEGVTSRLAEACLQQRSAPLDEGESAKTAVRNRVAEAADAAVEDVFLFPCGMTAIYAVYRAVVGLLPDRPTVQFGFPYVDTLKILQKCGSGTHFYPHGNREELEQLEAILKKEAVSGIFTEFPSNPLLRSPDLRRLSSLARRHRAPLIVDDTLATFVNADLLPVADAVCSSLTKFFSGVGDVAAGSVVLNPQGAFYQDLAQQLRDADDLLWCEDAIALERNSRDFVMRVEQINRNAERLANYLQNHERVAAVYYPKYQTPDEYRVFMKPGGGYGGLLSIDLVNPAENAPRFFDALRVCKGPNLGTNYTLVCPYTVLAHYHELEFAEACGVSRYLIRISVGLEDADDLIGRFKDALQTVEGDSASASTP